MTSKHTVQRLPKLYKTASKILQQVKEEGGSVKSLVYGAKHPNLKAIYALVLETLKHGRHLDYLVRKTKILLENPKLNPWVARVLMTELLWKKKALSAVSPPQKIVLSYKKQFLSELANIPKDEDASNSADTVAQQVRYVRVNTLKDTVENVINWFISLGWEEVVSDIVKKRATIETNRNLSSQQFMRDSDIPNLLVFPQDFRFYETELYSQGVIFLQDKASCVAAVLLNPTPGSEVLDMCAAPGMKTSQIAAIINNNGKVHAVEIHHRRYTTLCETVEKSGATCVKAINGDILRHSGQDMPDVEYIILDPPCSGSGMLSRKNIFSEPENKDSHRLAKLANFQCSLLRHAMTNFPSAKRIVYSTCSVHPEENEAVVDSVLKVLPPNFVPKRNPPFSDWMEPASSDYEFGSFGFYARPSTHLTNGFFVIVFDRSENDHVSSPKSLTFECCALEEKSVPENRGPKKKKVKVKEEENGMQKEEKFSQPDDVMQKMMKAMQKKSEPVQSESRGAVKEDDQNQSATGKKKRRKEKSKTTGRHEDIVGTEKSVETVLVEDSIEDKVEERVKVADEGVVSLLSKKRKKSLTTEWNE